MSRSQPRFALFTAIVLAPLATVGALLFGHDPAGLRARKPMIHRDGDFIGAAACEACHPDQHRTWRRTWHSTMTQRPDSRSVRGVFDGAKVGFFGKFARPFQRDGKFFMDLPTRAGGRRETEVALVVGSHRYQQYFEKLDRGDGTSIFRRLPILWHMEGGEPRWLHVNGIFLDPDNPQWPEHGSIWNENCIFCHTTAPQPRMANFDARPDDAAKAFDSHVADLGISCESCHGPGRAHADAMRDPTRRYRAHFDADLDLHIVHPDKLDKERSVAVCGQCHGQRIPRQLSAIRQYLERGPTFTIGDRLTEHVQPIRRDTKIGDEADAFALRFWKDGTPRLTAYEYQGVVDSACHLRGELTCGSCHTMHGGDPDGMLRPEMRTARACLQCHVEIGRDIAAHTRHDAKSSGSSCVACHMPDIIYGVFGVRISHRIENPDPYRDAVHDRPNACTMCHLDRSLTWAGEQMGRLFGAKYRVPGPRPGATLPRHAPDAVAAVLGGDPVLRAVYANAIGRPDAAGGDSLESALALVVTLGDSYTSVRDIARRSARALDARARLGLGSALRGYDTLDGTPAQRREALGSLLRAFARAAPTVRDRLRAPEIPSILTPNLDPDLPAITRTLDQQGNKVISIGR